MNKKILVTGGCGFIGSHLVESLVKNNFEVIVFDRYNISNNYGWLDSSIYRKDIEFILGDIRDYDSVINAVSQSSSIIHLAALIGIPYSYVSPLAYIKTNIEGTYNVLEAAKNNRIDQTIITSTSEIYGSAQYVPIDEKHPMVGQSPYSASKIAAEQLSTSYVRSFNLPVKIIRPFNVYGPRQSPRAVISSIISQLLSNSNNVNLGNMLPTRDFTYVTDTCEAIKEIYNNDNFLGEIVNIGSGQEISINELYNKINIILKSNKTLKFIKERSRPNDSEVDRLLCDSSKLKKIIKWNSKISLEEGLKFTIDWYKTLQGQSSQDTYHV